MAAPLAPQTRGDLVPPPPPRRAARQVWGCGGSGGGKGGCVGMMLNSPAAPAWASIISSMRAIASRAAAAAARQPRWRPRRRRSGVAGAAAARAAAAAASIGVGDGEGGGRGRVRRFDLRFDFVSLGEGGNLGVSRKAAGRKGWKRGRLRVSKLDFFSLSSFVDITFWVRLVHTKFKV